MTEPHPTPTDAERRAAVCAALASAPGLLRYAARFTRDIDDAEDAYQRAMEIALTRAPVVEHERFMAWLRTVLRNEAIAVGARRRRDGPSRAEDAAETADRVQDGGADTEALAEWRHRYRTLAEAFAGITEAQRICLILQAGGASYDLICRTTGYSRRKVERSILEGRAALQAWEDRIGTGEACIRIAEALERVAEGGADVADRRRVARHVRHCHHCRRLLRERDDDRRWLAALAPAALLGSAAHAAPPDPSPVLAWWERLATGATVRTGTAVQVALEAPGAVAAKVGAAAAAAVVAGSAGLPAVEGLVSGPDRPAVAAAASGSTRPAPDPAPASPTRRVVVVTAPSRGPVPSLPIGIPRVSAATTRGMTAERLSGVAVRVISTRAAVGRSSPASSGAPPPTPRYTAVPVPRTPTSGIADTTGARAISIGPGGS